MRKFDLDVPTTEKAAWSYFTSRPGGATMLVMDVRVGNKIRIPNATNITLLELSGRGVRLGIECDSETFAQRGQAVAPW